MALTDLRYALRTLLKARGFALVTVATLAIGIGATTAIFAAVSAFFLRPLPYPDADRIVRLRESFGQMQGSVSEQEWISENLLASPDYFRTLGIRLLAGRNLAATDRAGSPPVVLVNETLFAQFLGGQQPIGARVVVRDQPHEIVGIVSDVRRWGQARATVPETYFSAWQGVFETMTLAVRTKGDPGAMINSVRAKVAAVDPGQAVFAVRTMNDIVAESVAVRRFQTLLISLFAAVALVLASLGIYGVMAYHVGQRTQEMGIRMALGARAAQLQGMVVREGMLLAAIGLGIGLVVALVLALGLSRSIETVLFQVPAADLPSYIVAAAVLASVALLACWLPARRATRVDPMKALRSS